MITSKNEAKAMTEDISCDFKCRFNSTIYNSNQKNGIIEHLNVKVKIIVSLIMIIVGILAHIFVRIVSI